MTSKTTTTILSALKKLYQYRRKNRIGGLSNHFVLYLLDHISEYDRVLDLMEDDLSRRLLRWFIEFRLVNSIVLDKKITRTIVDPLICREDSNRLSVLAKKHPASQFEQSLDVDVIENWILEGYCLPQICEAAQGDYVLDVGAFNGNSTLYFAKKVGTDGRVFAVEPDPSTVETLQHNINDFKDAAAPIEVLNVAVSDKESELRFSKSGAASHVDPKGDTVVKARTIDNIVRDLDINHLDLIKMDVEGYEKQALIGAEETIKRFRPKLMVCIYHLGMDIVEIPTIIHDISPWYKMYVRHHAEHDGELVMYCVPINHHAVGLQSSY